MVLICGWGWLPLDHLPLITGMMNRFISLLLLVVLAVLISVATADFPKNKHPKPNVSIFHSFSTQTVHLLSEIQVQVPRPRPGEGEGEARPHEGGEPRQGPAPRHDGPWSIRTPRRIWRALWLREHGEHGEHGEHRVLNRPMKNPATLWKVNKIHCFLHR